ncbi:MAG TPA: hypothetical protein VEK79_01480 [Thermoanaerobaculia bacterium]|nr:hypothetical protein [Thermoanaerobaculia bacterium]
MRTTAVLLLLMTLTVAAATPKKKTPAIIAPDDVPHSIAQFMRSLSRDGARSVTFKATSTGQRFFFEEAAGVTVYRYKNGHYVREAFLLNVKLATAVKRYAKR